MKFKNPFKKETMETRVSEVKTIPLSQLEEANYNPRLIDESAMAGLKSSIQKFGIIDLPIVNKPKDGSGAYRIIGGHQRVRALRELEETDVQCVVVDMDEVEERAANLSLNNHHAQGSFDRMLLADMLSSLEDHVDFAELNFNDLVQEFSLDYDGAVGSPFTPNMNPEEGNSNVTDQDIQDTQADMDKPPEDSDKIKVLCPSCAEIFFIDKNQRSYD